MTVFAPHPAARAKYRHLFTAAECAPLSEADVAAGAGANFTAYDDVNVSLIPPDATHCSYYGNGPFANGSAMRAHLPHAVLSPCLLRPPVANLKAYASWEHGLSIDVEPSLFTPAQAAVIAHQALAQGIMPRIYFPLSWAAQVVSALHAIGLKRSDVQFHTAHWTGVAHVCSGITGTAWGTVAADQTQYTDTALGRSLDANLCLAHSYGPWGQPKPKPKPKPSAPRGQMAAKVVVDWDKPAGHRGFIAGLHTGTWKRSADQPLEVFQISVDGTGKWRMAGMPNTTPPLGHKPNPKPPPHKPAAGHNPVPGAVAEFGRVDQGADLNLSAAGYVAPYKCKILVVNRSSAGWSPQGSTANQYLAFEILEGPYAGQGIYVAEGINIVSGLSVGDVVDGGTKLADPKVNAYNNVEGNIETGWVAPDATRPLCQVLGSKSDVDQVAITCGLAMNVFFRKLGAPEAPNHSGQSPNWALLPAKLRSALGV